jgi:hypothetical protein
VIRSYLDRARSRRCNPDPDRQKVSGSRSSTPLDESSSFWLLKDFISYQGCGSGSARIPVLFCEAESGSGFRVKSWVQIRSEVKIQELLRLSMKPWSVCRALVAESLITLMSRIRIRIEVKGRIRIRIKGKPIHILQPCFPTLCTGS